MRIIWLIIGHFQVFFLVSVKLLHRLRILYDKKCFIDDYGILIVYRIGGKLPRKHEKVPIELSNTLDNTLKFSIGIAH